MRVFDYACVRDIVYVLLCVHVFVCACVHSYVCSCMCAC